MSTNAKEGQMDKHTYACMDFLLCWGLMTRQPLWVILCFLQEKGRNEIEEIVEEMKERNREKLELCTPQHTSMPGYN